MIITNNNSVYDKYKDEYKIILIDGKFKDVLLNVRDKIHEGYEMLTHPLSSSVKPNETPYKSVIISDKKGNLNYNSVMIIENAIMTCEKFDKIPMYINYTEQMIADFKLVDLTVLESALNNR